MSSLAKLLVNWEEILKVLLEQGFPCFPNQLKAREFGMTQYIKLENDTILRTFITGFTTTKQVYLGLLKVMR